MSKKNRMFEAYLKLFGLKANGKTYEEFMSYVSEYNNFCKIEKLATA